MQQWGQVFVLIQKEIKSDFRNSAVIAGIFLYVTILAFLMFLTFKQPTQAIWNGLYLVVLVFSGLQIGAKGFQTESNGHVLLMKTVVKPEVFWLAKWMYMGGIMLLVGAFSLLVFIGLMGKPDGLGLHWALVWLNSILALSSLFALMSAIAQVAGGGLALTGILAIPVAIPCFSLLTKLFQSASLDIPFSMIAKNFTLLSILSLSIAILAYVLFPFVWKTE